MCVEARRKAGTSLLLSVEWMTLWGRRVPSFAVSIATNAVRQGLCKELLPNVARHHISYG